MQPDKCILCGKSEGIKVYPISGSSDIYRIICPRCGEYKISHECFRYTPLPSPDIYLLSGLVREKNESDEYPEFLTTNIENQKKSYPVPDSNNIEAKAKKFLERLKARTEYFGQSIPILYQSDYPLAYARNDSEFTALLDFLREKKLITIGGEDNASCQVTLSAGGWSLVGTLEATNKDSEQGFVAAWFDESMNESIAAAQEAITECGYSPVCIKDEHFSEKIMDKALSEIRKSRFLVIDLTGARNSVFFEAGFAFGLNIETIYVYKGGADAAGLPPEFYVRHYQCYKYESPDELKELLKDAITARLKK
jgi:hypothetical protein